MCFISAINLDKARAKKLNRTLTNYIDSLIKVDLKEMNYEGVSNSEEG